MKFIFSFQFDTFELAWHFHLIEMFEFWHLDRKISLKICRKVKSLWIHWRIFLFSVKFNRDCASRVYIIKTNIAPYHLIDWEFNFERFCHQKSWNKKKNQKRYVCLHFTEWNCSRQITSLGLCFIYIIFVLAHSLKISRFIFIKAFNITDFI